MNALPTDTGQSGGFALVDTVSQQTLYVICTSGLDLSVFAQVVTTAEPYNP